MDVYAAKTITAQLSGNPYAGRGLIVGTSADGKHAAVAYFIMGRSANSRNRVFAMQDGAVFTQPFDASKVQDPSLIIYAAAREFGNKFIVTNGDQTDTIYNALKAGGTFHDALSTREFEPDKPNYTPRISAMLNVENGAFTYEMNILKSADAEGSACLRQYFEYPAIKGVGHFLHTYVTDGNPLPSFVGEPERVLIPDTLDAFADEIWNALDNDNKISLFVRFIDVENGAKEDKIINKYV